MNRQKIHTLKSFIKEHQNKVPKFISIYVNDECNLKCKHCYSGWMNKKHSYTPLSLQEWKKILKQGIDLGITNYSICGREPLLAWPKTKGIIRFLRKNNCGVSLGSNGTLLTNEIARELKKLDIDILQISLDGTKETHENIRGEGTFNKTIESILTAQKHKIPTITAFTLMKDNYNQFDAFLKEVQDRGIEWLTIAFYFSPLYKSENNQDYKFRDAYINAIKKIIKRPPKIPVVISICSRVFPVLKEKGLLQCFSKETKHLDFEIDKNINTIYHFANNKITIVIEPYPIDIRISADGYFTKCLNMSSSDFRQKAKNLRIYTLKNLINNTYPYASRKCVSPETQKEELSTQSAC